MGLKNLFIRLNFHTKKFIIDIKQSIKIGNELFSVNHYESLLNEEENLNSPR